VNASFETAGLAWPFSFEAVRDPENCEAVFRKDHAQTRSWSAMAI
jgi:hypothetical protein